MSTIHEIEDGHLCEARFVLKRLKNNVECPGIM